ncbi:MAG: type III-B CRISPR module RAMP protein Cmr6 [Pseudanabaenaceae cyanobacterium bins.39]|nr:type III-B CRISPR module RAMP protein Cmr6 [Pseudanabaenaceae cyanobacterium bins.39]
MNRSNLCSNLSLLLDRYIGYKQEAQKPWKFQEEQKTELFKKIAKEFEFSDDLIESNYQRSLAGANSLPHARTFTASPEWRMVVGLGSASILETAMTLDRVTGIPIIPASALKGLAASYAMLSVLETTQREEAEKNPDHDFANIFGTQDQAGKVIFLDAVATEAPTLEPDIMNCHYPDYYGGKTPNPTPYQSPNPVYFLTLGRKSKFGFALAGCDSSNSTAALVRLAEKWLKSGLQELGIGAKTAAGYGYLEVSES